MSFVFYFLWQNTNDSAVVINAASQLAPGGFCEIAAAPGLFSGDSSYLGIYALFRTMRWSGWGTDPMTGQSADQTYFPGTQQSDGTAVATSSTGLLPLNQTAQLILPDLAYHDYEGVALDLDERPRLQRDLSHKNNIMLLRNHGTLTVGRSVAEAFLRMYLLERACTMQVRTLTLGGTARATAPAVIEKNAALAQSPAGCQRSPDKLGVAGPVAKARPYRPELSTLTAASNLPCPSAVSRSCGPRNACPGLVLWGQSLDRAEILKDVDCRVEAGIRRECNAPPPQARSRRKRDQGGRRQGAWDRRTNPRRR